MKKKSLNKEIKRRRKLSEWEQFEIETADPVIFKIHQELPTKRGRG
jgi:hypothetical protein